jgi:succinate-acetate transporter protein
MGKYAGVVIGAIVLLAGVLGLIRWSYAFIVILKGAIPAMMIFGGAIAVIAGISEIKDETGSKKE